MLTKLLSGKKTYLVALAAGIVIFLQMIGAIDYDLASTLLSLLGVTGLVTLRAGITKAEKK